MPSLSTAASRDAAARGRALRPADRRALSGWLPSSAGEGGLSGGGCAAAPRRLRVPPARARRRQRGVTMVEFALMAPFALVLLVGTVIGGIFSMNYVQLTNAVRDGVRAAAVCGGNGRNNQSQLPTSQIPKLPDGNPCTDDYLKAFIRDRFQAIPGNQATLNVTLPTGGSGDHMSQCQYRKTIEIKATYDQPLYMPLISKFLSNNGSGSTYTITAQAEATCEQ